MKKLPMSDYLNEYYAKHNITIDDFSKATIIWNSRLPWCGKLASLKQLYAATEDEGLKNQLKERIDYETTWFDNFKKNEDKKYIYKVTKYDDGSGAVYFTDVKRALEYGRKECKTDGIEVEKIIVDPDEGDEYDVESICEWNKEGTVIEYFYQQIHYMDAASFQDDYHGKPDRFERAFLPDLVNPFQRGDIVRNVYTGEMGVAIATKESWDRLVTNYKSREWPELSFVERNLETVYVDKDGEFMCHDFCFLDCEKITEIDRKDDEMVMMDFLSNTVQGKGALWDFRYCRERLIGR